MRQYLFLHSYAPQLARGASMAGLSMDNAVAVYALIFRAASGAPVTLLTLYPLPSRLCMLARATGHPSLQEVAYVGSLNPRWIDH